MILRDIPSQFVIEFTAVPLISNIPFPKNGLGKITPNTQHGEYTFYIENLNVDFYIKDENKINDFNLYLQRGYASLSEIIIVNKDNSAVIKTVFFYGGIVAMDSIDIGIDDKIFKTIEKNLPSNSRKEACEKLKSKITITIADETYFVAYFGNAALIDFKSDSETLDSNSQNDTQPDIEKFSIFGENLKIPVEKTKEKVTEKVTLENGNTVDLEKDEEFFLAGKIVFGKHRRSESALKLVNAEIKFSDWSRKDTGKLQAVAAGAMKRLCQDDSSYLKKWDEYNEELYKSILEKARNIDVIYKTRKPEYSNGFFRFYFDKEKHNELKKILRTNDALEITTQMPLYLKNKDLTFSEYCIELEREFEQKKQEEQERKKEKDSKKEEVFSVICEVRNVSDNYIELNIEDINDIPDNAFLVYSILGDKVQIERKLDARKKIIEGRSANPLLGLLIEEKGELPMTQRVTKIKPLSPFVKDKIFKHEPTIRQKEAIELALNTPDICLIQGPPGTGKTTVITAIIERLNEEFDKSKNIHGEILVSGFQHDAVENIVSRLSVNSLPGVKFGGRKKDQDDKNSSIDEWCNNVANKIREKNPQIKDTIEQQKLSELFFAYTINPSIKNVEAILKGIISFPRNIISTEIIGKAKNILDELTPEIAKHNSDVLSIIYGIRTNSESFSDDGVIRIQNILDNKEISEKLSADELKCLNNLCERDTYSVSDFSELRKIRTKLLNLFIPRKAYTRNKQKENILEICKETSEYLQKHKPYEDKEEEILVNFLMEIENNPDGIKEMVANHSFVFAATTGQSVGTGISKKKKSFLRNPEFETIKYDTIIIDEAARVSPMDLLIPMVNAEKRIILVGDHRQLPHIIDEEIAKKLEGENANKDEEQNYLKHSMFQYMFNRLKRLEEKDGICRTVTLDAQYRMHPQLGNFVSENFYGLHNEAFRSPLEENYFTHSLPKIENKYAVWLNIPNAKGKEDKDETGSRFRNSEIETIAKYLYEWQKSKTSKDLSFGVISFYKAQVERIKVKLSELGVKESEKLKIGTVDSFQGMEFDVVFLSAVRTEEKSKYEKYEKYDVRDEKKQQKLFGFLMSKNRLCVSMSRQKKVLVVAGDKYLFVSEIAKQAVPELANFYQLCNEKGVVL